MQTSLDHPSQIIEAPPINLVSCCAFISIDIDPKIENKKAAIALVDVDLDVVGYSTLRVWELRQLPLDHNVINQYIFDLHKQKLIDRLYIDYENYIWFNGKRQYQEACKTYLIDHPKANLPSLRPLGEIEGKPERGKDLTVRQVTLLKGALARGEIIFAEHLTNDPQIKAEMNKVGQSVVCDALAGAVYKGRDIQANLRKQFNYLLVKHQQIQQEQLFT